MIYDEIGENIHDARKEKGLSQEELANGTNMSVAHFRKIEHGQTNTTIKTLKRISDAMAVPLNRIVFTEGGKTAPQTNHGDF